MEHPSLKPQPMRSTKTAAETIINLNREINSIQETIANIKEKSVSVETDLSSLDSISILANLEKKFSDFTDKYASTLDKLAENAKAEAELIILAKEKLNKL